MRVLVTGASGFLGQHVTPLLVDRGHHVIALARSLEAADRVEALGAEAIGGDLDDEASVDGAFTLSKADALVNLASLGFGHAPAVVAAAAEARIVRAVFISTTAIFTTLDASSKLVRLAAEETVRLSGLDWTILRPTMIYGTPDDRNMARLLRLLRRSSIVPMPGGGRHLQQPVHVADVAQAVVAALESPASIGRAYDIAGPEALTLRKVVDEAAAALGRRASAVSLPLQPMVGAARLYERFARHPRLKPEQLERLAEDKAFDIGAARADLGYAPRSFRDGITDEAAMLA